MSSQSPASNVIARLLTVYAIVTDGRHNAKSGSASELALKMLPSIDDVLVAIGAKTMSEAPVALVESLKNLGTAWAIVHDSDGRTLDNEQVMMTCRELGQWLQQNAAAAKTGPTSAPRSQHADKVPVAAQPRRVEPPKVDERTLLLRRLASLGHPVSNPDKVDTATLRTRAAYVERICANDEAAAA